MPVSLLNVKVHSLPWPLPQGPLSEALCNFSQQIELRFFFCYNTFAVCSGYDKGLSSDRPGDCWGALNQWRECKSSCVPLWGREEVWALWRVSLGGGSSMWCVIQGGGRHPCCAHCSSAFMCVFLSDVQISIKLLWWRNGGGKCTKWLSHLYLSHSALMLISVECRHPAFIQIFGFLLTRWRQRENRKDEKRRIRDQSGWNMRHPQSRCGIFMWCWLHHCSRFTLRR